MQVNFNPTVSNNKQSVSFGAVNQKWLKKIKDDSFYAATHVLDDTHTFHKDDPKIMKDLKDTINEALKLNYVVGENAKKYYREFANKFLSKY